MFEDDDTTDLRTDVLRFVREFFTNPRDQQSAIERFNKRLAEYTSAGIRGWHILDTAKHRSLGTVSDAKWFWRNVLALPATNVRRVADYYCDDCHDDTRNSWNADDDAKRRHLEDRLFGRGDWRSKRGSDADGSIVCGLDSTGRDGENADAIQRSSTLSVSGNADVD